MKNKIAISMLLCVLPIFQGCEEQKSNSKEAKSNLKPLIESFFSDLNSTDKSFKYILNKYILISPSQWRAFINYIYSMAIKRTYCH